MGLCLMVIQYSPMDSIRSNMRCTAHIKCVGGRITADIKNGLRNGEDTGLFDFNTLIK
jgi:hypothetical protein